MRPCITHSACGLPHWPGTPHPPQAAATAGCSQPESWHVWAGLQCLLVAGQQYLLVHSFASCSSTALLTTGMFLSHPVFGTRPAGTRAPAHSRATMPHFICRWPGGDVLLASVESRQELDAILQVRWMARLSTPAVPARAQEAARLSRAPAVGLESTRAQFLTPPVAICLRLTPHRSAVSRACAR